MYPLGDLASTLIGNVGAFHLSKAVFDQLEELNLCTFACTTVNNKLGVDSVRRLIKGKWDNLIFLFLSIIDLTYRKIKSVWNR